MPIFFITGRFITGRFIIVCLVLVNMLGCGFHLAGRSANIKAIPPLKIESTLPSIWQQRLYRFLKVRDVEILQSSDIELIISNFTTTKRPVSLNSRAKVAEYRIGFSFDIMAIDKQGRLLMSKKTLQTERIYRFNEEQVPGKQAEEDFLKFAMIDELYDQMLRHLSYALRAETNEAEPVKSNTVDATRDL